MDLKSRTSSRHAVQVPAQPSVVYTLLPSMVYDNDMTAHASVVKQKLSEIQLFRPSSIATPLPKINIR